jgi:hypothetical protein
MRRYLFITRHDGIGICAGSYVREDSVRLGLGKPHGQFARD